MAAEKKKGSKKGTGVYHPPVDLPAQVQSYNRKLGAESAQLGVPTGSSQADLAPLVVQAVALQPQADAIAALERQLLAKKQAYNRDAKPLWDLFDLKLEHARTDANKTKNAALKEFLSHYGARPDHHADAPADESTPPAPPVPSGRNPPAGSGQ
jgi:hypothetical protein